MSTTPTPEELAATAALEAAAAEQTPEEVEAAAAAAKEASVYDGLPTEFEWMKAKLESQGREAQGLRERIREKDAALANAKTPEEVAEVEATFKSQIDTLTLTHAKERALLKHDVPEHLQKYLTGSTDEELAASAAELAGVPVVPPTQVVITKPAPTGGLKPAEDAKPEDGGSEYLKWKKSQ